VTTGGHERRSVIALPCPDKPRLRRTTVAMWLVGYLLLFGILTLQDRLARPQPVPYTEFKKQVTA